MKNCVLALLLCIPILTIGQASQATLLAHWDDESIPQAFFANPYHDAWGAVVNDKEIGIITSTLGIHFFDLSNTEAEFEPVAFAPAPVQGNTIGHRDVKTYLHYAYAVADEGASTLQAIDMSGLPESVEVVYDSDEFIRTTHNIFIDEDNARLYAVGGSGFNLRILSLENPEQPELLASYPRQGRLHWIGTRPLPRGEVLSVEKVEITISEGIVGDHYQGRSKQRQVTLIQWEHLDVVARLMQVDQVDPALLRRNLVVAGINVQSLIQSRFRIGEVILEGTGACHPCSRMEENLGPGGYQAMRGHGGITCKVISSGIVHLNDPVIWLENPDRASKKTD